MEQCDEVVKVQEEQLSEEVLWVESGILLSCSLYCPVNQSELVIFVSTNKYSLVTLYSLLHILSGL